MRTWSVVAKVAADILKAAVAVAIVVSVARYDQNPHHLLCSSEDEVIDVSGHCVHIEDVTRGGSPGG